MEHPAKKPIKPAGKRPWLLPALLCAGLALAGALVLLLPWIQARFPAQRYPEPVKESTAQTLGEADPAQVTAISVRHIAGDGYTLEQKDGALFLHRGDALLDLNDAVAQQFMEAVSRITATERVASEEEARGHLADMGLDPARTVVSVTWTDKSVTTLEIGSIAPESACSYFRWSGASGVYLCDPGVTDLFAMTENRLLPMVQPSLIRSLIDRAVWTGPEGAVEIALTPNASGGAAGALLAPQPYPLDPAAAASLLDCLANLRLGALEGPLTEENRSAYGFDSPLCVLEAHQRAGTYTDVDEEGRLRENQAEEQTLRFTFGRAEGDYFYTCLYEGSVYLVSRMLAEPAVQGGASKWVSRRPAAMEGEARAIVATRGGKRLDIRVERREQVLPNNQLAVDEAGNLLYDVAITANGQAMTQEALDGLWARLAAMTVSGDVPSGWFPGGAAPRWELTLSTWEGETRQITAYPLDAFSDAVAVDGVVLHFAYIEAFDMALGELKNLL